ncbi:MAG: response regulator transcription factor [Hymenobacter sp.]|nr:MAG: response regulator transcription factor [Hymenobacter sp.]
MKASTTTVLVAVEPTLYRSGLVALLHEQWPTLPLTLTSDVGQVVNLVRAQQFQLLILDGNLSGRSLPDLLHQLHQVRPTQQVLVLAADRQSQLPTPPQLVVPRHITPSCLVTTLALWLDSTPCQSPPYRALWPVPTQFSARELEVLRLVVDDNCNREIANCLYLSVRTIESHRRSLLQKSGTRTLAGLVAWALREGMVA